MRTIKALACAAALAAGLATAMAQSNVYSLNVVGYYNVTIPAGNLFMIANQLNTTNNEIQYIIPAPLDDTQIYKFTGSSFEGQEYEDFLGGWADGTWTLNPGEAAFISVPNEGNGAQTFTFVGTVLQGSLTNTPFAVGNVCYRSAMVPMQGTPTSFGIVPQDDDQMYVYNYPLYAGDEYEDFLGGWNLGGGNGPTVLVGQGFAYQKPSYNTANAWVQNFTVQ